MDTKNHDTNEKRCEANVLPLFLEALEFMKEREGFNTVELQKFLKCSFHDVMRVIDAAEALGLILKNEDETCRYKYITNLS